MENLELWYNDKAYHKITDQIQKTFVDSIKSSIEKALNPIKKEIEKSDGFVKVNYKENKLIITTFYLPIELEHRVNKILK